MMTGLIEKGLLAGLGVLTLTRDKVVQFVSKLVEEGEVKQEEAPGVIERLMARGEEERGELRKLIRQELDRATPISRRDIEELNSKVEVLTAQVEKLTSKKAVQE
jgi:polyhydroxyalkanoate synthesis regulator phasin